MKHELALTSSALLLGLVSAATYMLCSADVLNDAALFLMR